MTNRDVELTLIIKVLEYLNKKGFSRSEWMLRKETGDPAAESSPIALKNQEMGGENCAKAFRESVEPFSFD